ncbi:DNA-directed RNA polymerase I subunit RPA49 [Operophtera brumata]|uniref:DNA-directed RNA polymerase I subunit RPA49 n=1 Tax=Operophtera brumata TaxID=104452 RepID=A0A0L7KWJ9_OPEBR|nr:DNA-directed RNA polymerase I subunit RPA49 [Operophtera brumata]
MPPIHIDEVCPKSEIYPFIVNFQNGYPTEHFKSRECLVLIDEQSGSKTIATDVGHTLYTGEETGEALGRTLILARNRKTGKVRLIEVGNIEVKPEIKNDLESSELLDNSALELGRKFGSKKYKKYLEQSEKLKQNEQAVVAQMVNVSQNLTQDQLDVSYDSQAETDNFYIPPINREATAVTEVYDIDVILTPEQYEAISNDIDGIDLMEKLNPVIKGLPRKDLTQKQKVLALYASSLYNLYFVKSTEIMKKGFIACYESQTLHDHILQHFFTYVNGKRCRPIQYRDKTLIHTMVLMLLINNFKFNFDEFCKLTKAAVRTMTSKLAMTGAYVVNVNSVRMAQLKIPLNKPPTRRKSSKF